MEVRAITRYVHISPSKAGDFSRVIQGKSVVEALAIVELSPRKAARLVGKTLKSALANALNNYDLKKEDLTVKSAVANPARCSSVSVPGPEAWPDASGSA
jgi:large subunit ribosomal protein L22